MNFFQVHKRGLFLVGAIILFGGVHVAMAVTDSKVTINDGESKTEKRQVELTLQAPLQTNEMRISNDRDELLQKEWGPFRDTKDWTLPGQHGSQTVYVQFKNREGEISRIYRDSITLEIREEPKIEINEEALSTDTRRVNLYIVPPQDARSMRVANSRNLVEEEWRSARRDVTWDLTTGNGRKYVYVQFKDASGNIGNIYQDTIILDAPVVPVAEFTINGGAKETTSKEVYLLFTNVRGYDQIRISNSKSFANSAWQPMTRSRVPWVINGGSRGDRVYVEFKTMDGQIATSDEGITYKPEQEISDIDSGPFLGEDGLLYYLGEDARIHLFSSLAAYHSFFPSLANMPTLTSAEMKFYQVGTPICVRQGTWLIKFEGSSRIYAVEPGCQLTQLRSEVEAYVWYGPLWNERIITEPAAHRRMYGITALTEYSTLQDPDQDGVTGKEEETLGSAEGKADSDGDGMSDFEEIRYWHTKPGDADTDGDGIQDGREVMIGQDPRVSGAALTTLPEGSYPIPQGALVMAWWNQNHYYYKGLENSLYPVAQLAGDSAFRTNNFQKQFAVKPPYKLNETVRTDTIRSNDNMVKQPLKRVSGRLLPI